MDECINLKGRMKEICECKTNLSLEAVNKYRNRWGIKELSITEYSYIRRSIKPSLLSKKELVGTALKKRINDLIKIKTGKGCGCNNLANDMDSWGIEGCKKNRDKIVEHLVNNRDMLLDAIKNSKDKNIIYKISGLSLEILPDIILLPILRFGASYLLDLAIADIEEQNKFLLSKKALSKPKCRNPKIVMPLSAEQLKLHKNAILSFPESKDPFIKEPVFHFGAHLWPVRGKWDRHKEYWNELSKLVNGKCIIVVATDDTTDTFEDVKKQFSEKFEFVHVANNPDGENQSFKIISDNIPQGQDDILIYCHGKGVRPHTFSSESVSIWIEHMYETVVFNFDEAIKAFENGYRCFGSYRTFGDMPLSPKNRWHYSGTFFIVRAKYLTNTKVKKGYGGVECWPGENIEAKYSYCSFMDGQPFKIGYDINAMYPKIVDAQMDWEVKRLGGPRCEQHKRELDWFLNYIKEDDKILVIGSKHGGLEYQIRKSKKNVSIISCDIAPQPDNTENLIIGDSSSLEVQDEIVRNGPYDVIFIDGDHSYTGVYNDWIFAKSLNPRIIAFHDIAVAIKHLKEGCEVDKLWAEIKSKHTTSEKIVGCGWGGIGIVFND